MLLTFFLVVIGWIIFRAESIGQAWEYIQGMVQFGTIRASYRYFTLIEMWPTNILIIVMLLVEWLHRDREHGLQFVDRKHSWWHIVVYVILVLCIEYYASCFLESPNSFIYFQF